MLVQAGLTPLEALQAATLNPARFLGREKDFGIVAPGKFADLVLLDANPLEDINNTRKIAADVYRGKLYPRASLDDMLAKIESLAGKKSIGEVLEPIIKEKGVEAAIRQYRELKSTHPDSYDFDEKYELQHLGNELLDAKKFEDAIQMYKLSAEEFPDWWWIYDSLGEAYTAIGQKELAIRNYEKSLELDPSNQHAALKLKQLNSK
ncbi:MAG TPA: amidohydrolase family protein [Candidatus Acidoferrales bacterium]|nr:amidohydrolase family protein [Candidatus Acidoferrales bacterium]